jgi:SET domain-containing protein
VTTVASWLSPKARKGEPSAIEGRGLFAIEPIVAGEVVAVKGGHIVDTATLRALPRRLQETDIQIAEGLHLAALTDDEFESVMLFINHSCDANVGIAGNVVLATMRDVAAGDELTLDYCLFDTSPTTPMECHCGSAACRKVITPDDWRRPELQARYAGWFSRYVADRQGRIGTRSLGA